LLFFVDPRFFVRIFRTSTRWLRLFASVLRTSLFLNGRRKSKEFFFGLVALSLPEGGRPIGGTIFFLLANFGGGFSCHLMGNTLLPFLKVSFHSGKVSHFHIFFFSRRFCCPDPRRREFETHFL